MINVESYNHLYQTFVLGVKSPVGIKFLRGKSLKGLLLLFKSLVNIKSFSDKTLKSLVLLFKSPVCINIIGNKSVKFLVLLFRSLVAIYCNRYETNRTVLTTTPMFSMSFNSFISIINHFTLYPVFFIVYLLSLVYSSSNNYIATQVMFRFNVHFIVFLYSFIYSFTLILMKYFMYKKHITIYKHLVSLFNLFFIIRTVFIKDCRNASDYKDFLIMILWTLCHESYKTNNLILFPLCDQISRINHIFLYLMKSSFIVVMLILVSLAKSLKSSMFTTKLRKSTVLLVQKSVRTQITSLLNNNMINIKL